MRRQDTGSSSLLSIPLGTLDQLPDLSDPHIPDGADIFSPFPMKHNYIRCHGESVLTYTGMSITCIRGGSSREQNGDYPVSPGGQVRRASTPTSGREEVSQDTWPSWRKKDVRCGVI